MSSNGRSASVRACPIRSSTASAGHNPAQALRDTNNGNHKSQSQDATSICKIYDTTSTKSYSRGSCGRVQKQKRETKGDRSIRRVSRDTKLQVQEDRKATEGPRSPIEVEVVYTTPILREPGEKMVRDPWLTNGRDKSPYKGGGRGERLPGRCVCVF